MENFLQDLESDSFGLNIVCNDDANGNKISSLALKKPRKAKNKYEKRRANSKRTKKQQKEQMLALEIPPDANESFSKNEKKEVVKSDKKHSIVDDGENGIDKVGHIPKSSDLKEMKSSTENLNHGDLWKEMTNPANFESSSRKNQHAITTRVLQDEAKRASYLSTFHARPYEIDRRTGATPHIKESKESSHIFHFENVCDTTDHAIHEKNSNLGEDETETAQSIFTKCGLHSNLVRAITSEKFQLQHPTKVQRNSWLEMLSPKREDDPSPYKNLFIQSETGSGKTLAYLLVVLQSMGVDKRTGNLKRVERHIGGTRAVILCPTRELATQTYVVAEKLCQNTFPWLVAGCLSGGEKRKSEKARVRKGISVLIATPGRLLDHLEKTDCLLMALKGKVEWIVLDESDRLLDMGLGSQVEQIVQIIRANQSGSGLRRDGVTWRSILVSATISGTVKQLSSKLLGGDVWCWATAIQNNDFQDERRQIHETDQVDKNDQELASAAPQQLTQHHIVVSSKLRLSALVAFLVARVQRNERVVLFMSTCDGVDFHYNLFKTMQQILNEDKSMDTNSGIFGGCCDIFRLHGNVAHRERHSILQSFSKIKQEKASILITTDVTARGLNMPEVDWIVQYDPPCETADYVHRAGRAARAGKSGHALLFLLPSETQYIEVLSLRGLKNISALSLASTLETAAKICTELTREGLELTGQGNKTIDGRIGEAFSTAIQNRLETCVLDDDRTFRETALKKLEAIASSDKLQKKKKRRETKQAVGPLLESARNAYFSYVRGYSTKEKAVRHIFSARALHLGHVARSFALQEQPKELVKAHKLSGQSSQIDDEDLLRSTGKKRNNNLAFNKSNRKMKTEYADPLVDETPIPKTKKVKTSGVVSFFNNDNDNPKDDTQKQTSRNIKEKMMAAASSLQSSGMEFW